MLVLLLLFIVALDVVLMLVLLLFIVALGIILMLVLLFIVALDVVSVLLLLILEIVVVDQGCGEQLSKTLLAKACGDCLKNQQDPTNALYNCFMHKFLGIQLIRNFLAFQLIRNIFGSLTTY